MTDEGSKTGGTKAPPYDKDGTFFVKCRAGVYSRRFIETYSRNSCCSFSSARFSIRDT